MTVDYLSPDPTSRESGCPRKRVSSSGLPGGICPVVVIHVDFLSGEEDGDGGFVGLEW